MASNKYIIVGAIMAVLLLAGVVFALQTTEVTPQKTCSAGTTGGACSSIVAGEKCSCGCGCADSCGTNCTCGSGCGFKGN